MKTILAATDFSISATNALQYAAALASRTGARLVLFNAFQLSSHASLALVSAAGMDEMFQSNKKALEQLAEAIARSYKIETAVCAINGYFTEVLDETVAREGASLVVLGMHTSDWSDHMFGNTTISLIANTSYPLLIVPEKVDYTGIEKILFAFDPHCIAAQNKLSALQEVARGFGAEVEVFHVEAGSPQLATAEIASVRDSKVEAALAEVPHTYKEVAGSNIAQSIEKELEGFGASLLAVIPQRKGLVDRLMNKSITRKLALKAPVPLLVLPSAVVV